MGNVTSFGYNEIDIARTGASINGAGTKDDNRPRVVESELDIVVNKKQIKDTKSGIYYALKRE